MTNPTIRIFNSETGETLDREMSADEFAAYQAEQTAAALEAAKVPTAAEKLFNATGLTVAEYKALGL